MPGSSSPEPSPWWEIPLDWPIEHVACQLTVVEPRRLSALEWALLRVLEAFEAAPPTLEEAAEELGLGEPRFLADVLRELLTHETLAPRPGVDEAGGLEQVRFTERGLELFRKGQVDGEPVTQGHGLCFDVLTDEALPVATTGTPRPGCPVIDPDRLPEPREEVGLERLRAIVQRFGPPVGGADALIRGARVATRIEAPKLRSGYGWVTRPLALVPTPEGRLALHTPALTAEQRRRLTDASLEQWVTPARAVTQAWAPHPDFQRGRQPLGTWGASTERLVPVAEAVQDAKRLVAGARREVLLHAAWAAAPGLTEALTAAASRGVAVYVLGAATTRVQHWSVAPRRAPGFVIEVMRPGLAPGALVVDGREALLLDEVVAEVEELGRYAFEVVGALRARAAALGAELRQALLEALPPIPVCAQPPLDVCRAHSIDSTLQHLLEESSLRLSLARLVLQPTAAVWSGIESWLATRCDGAARVAAIQEVAGLVGRLIPDVPSAPWSGAGTEAWRAFHRAILAAGPERVPDDVLRALIRLAPQDTAPEPVLDPLVAAWVQPGPATQSAGPLHLLERLRLLVEPRWPGAAPRCPGFLAALERCLEVTPPPPEAQALSELAGRIAAAAPAEHAKRWARDVAALWPAPLHMQAFEAWRKRHEPLGLLLGPALSTRFAEHWRSLIAAAPAHTEEHLAEQLRAIQGVLAPSEVLASLLPEAALDDVPGQVEHLVRLRGACRSVWKQDAPGNDAWNGHLRALLTVPPEGYSHEVHGPLIGDLGRRLRGWPGAQEVLRAWARALVKTLPPPVRAEGLVWWLESLRGLAEALGPELLETASTALLRHAGALRDARLEAAPLWEQVVESWRGLGLDVSSLEARIAPPAAAPVPAHPKKKQGKKGKKR